jgi:hypothetical protein
VCLVLAVLLGIFLVKGVKNADVGLIHQQQEQKQLQHEHSLDRQQQEAEKNRAVQQTTATAEKQDKLKASEEEQLEWNRTHSDPAPPVGAEKINGEWWFSALTPNKAYIYIENVGPGSVQASMPGGRVISLHCAVMRSTDFSHAEESPVCTGLPNSIHSWVRVSMGSTFNAGSSAPAEGWSLLWHEGDKVETYQIQSFCDPKCTLLSDKMQPSPDQKTPDQDNQHH